MNYVKALINELILSLKSLDEKNEFDFISEYPSSHRPSPITRPTAVFGLNKLSFEEGGFGDYLGTDKNGHEVYGRKCSAAISMRLYMPRALEASASYAFFDMINLLWSSSRLKGSIAGVNFGSARSDKYTDCFLSEGEIRISARFETVVDPVLTLSSLESEGVIK